MPEQRNRTSERNISLARLRRSLREADQELDFLIAATPTGERRNTITEINISVKMAIRKTDSLRAEKDE